MDPVSQGVLGAIAAQTPSKAQQLAKAAFIGAVGGMAPDLDVLISSETDPLLSLEFHRQFTHSLLFIPIGGLLCALLLYPLLSKRWGFSFRHTWLLATLGFATHGLLDGCTSYGTQLLWPLTDHRFAWDSISIIDPLFTVPLVLLTMLAAIFKSRKPVIAAIVWVTLYLGFGFVQHERAERLAHGLAESRGHEPLRLDVKPSFGNLIVWKSVYEADGRFYVDALKPGLTIATLWEGSSVPKLDIERDIPWLKPDSVQARDLQRFDWFSAGFTALDQDNPNRVTDMRYSLLPHHIKPLWGIELSPAAQHQHIDMYSERGDSRAALKTLFNMILE